MRKVVLIALREYKAAVRTKAFLISLLLMPVLLAGTSAIQYFTRKQLDTEDKHFAVIDRMPGSALYPLLLKRTEQRNANHIYDEETHQQNKAAFLLEKIEPSAETQSAIEEQRLEMSSRRVRHPEIDVSRRRQFLAHCRFLRHASVFRSDGSQGRAERPTVFSARRRA